MEVMLREKFEEILLKLAETLEPGKVSDDAFEDALQDALDEIEALLMPDHISPDWLMTEYEVMKDTDPGISTEDLLTRLAEAINEKLKSRE